MKRFEKPQSPTFQVAIIVSLAAVFVVDLLTPIGMAEWVFYLVPVALSFYSWRPRTPLLVAAACTALLAAGMRLSPALSSGWSPIIPRLNRAMVVVALWFLAMVGRKLIRARIALREEDWIRSGQRDLGIRMQGEQTLHELGDNILRFLCPYLDVPVGAFYVSDEDNQLRRAAAYALDPREESAGREVVGPGQGLLGQAAKEKRILRLDDLPEGYLRISSALGAAKPQHLVLAPVEVDGMVKGALELGFLHPIGRSDMDLIGATAGPIATAIRSSQHRTALEELLGKTQRQAEELQTQQEELRVANEELESQSKALLVSQSRLEAQQAELEQTNSQLEEQAQALGQQRDELSHAQAELVERADELGRANQYKSEFLANMSHELRTPLNSALILAKLLADNSQGNLTPEQVKYASTIYSSGNDLLLLINDILDLSRVEAGRIELHLEPVEPSRIVEALEQSFGPVATQKSLRFETRVDPDAAASITTDALRVQQILRNLLSNAFKFTDSGEVVLRVSTAGSDQISFAVRDTGIGIPAEQQGSIFEAFRQADRATQSRYGGTGLGLTISRQLARRLSGEILVESAPGKGSTFTLLVPRDLAQDLDREPPSPISPVRDQASAQPLSMPARAGAHPAPARPPPRPGVEDDRDRIKPNERTILIIEDDSAFASIVCDLARDKHFRCLVAASAGEGIELAERFVPSAVVLDIHLPDSSGLTVLERLKRHPATRHIPVHAISVGDYSQQALELGAIGFAIKPVMREQLVQAFQKLEQKLEQKIRRVLVVEDSAQQRESLVALLSSTHVEVVSVATAREAMERLKETTFDTMVLDLSLPEMSGYELLDKMAAGEAFSFPPVIVYTGRSLSREEEQRLRRHASSIIIKGARSPERLLDEVTLFLHQVEDQLPQEQQRILREVRSREAALEGRIVLVVEDDVRNVFALSSVLEPRGAKLRIARNGREALQVLERMAHEPGPGVDLVLMDVMMPEMDGLTATREIRKRPEWKNLPIIALTAKAMPDDRERCLQAGANDYIAKPLDIEKLISLVKVWMPK
jgi:CheY-like chemotaxis protein